MNLFRKKNLNDLLVVSKTNKDLKKILGPIDLIMIGIGAIVGTGIFVLTGSGAVTAGPALTISFILSAIICAFAALCYAEFASSIPVAGSIYTYSYATLGELIAWIIGWDLMLEYGLMSATVSVGWSGYFQSLLQGFDIILPATLTAAPGSIAGVESWFNLPAFSIVLMLTAMLSIGIKESSRFNNLMVILKIAVVLLFIFVGYKHVRPENWQPFAPHGINGIFSAAALVFFAFIGFDAVSSAAEEVKHPGRDLPIGIIASLAICTILYVIVSLTMTGIVPYHEFLDISHPMSLALQYANERWFSGFVDLGAILGMTTVILIMTYGQTRILFAMSRDGLLPQRLSKIHPRFGTPFLATWILGFCLAFIAALVPLNVLAELTNIGTLAAFALIAVAIIVLRKTHPDLPRSFRCPAVPFVPLFSIIFCIALMTFLQKTTWIAFAIWLLLGLVVYFSYARKHSLLNQQ